MKKYTYYSDDYKYSEHDAYANCIDKVTHNHKDYHILAVITDSWHCDGCNDYHYSCEITIELPHNAPTDLAVKLGQLGM